MTAGASVGAAAVDIRKRESFVKGAMMLAMAALISRLLGALYKPIVTRIFAPYDGHGGAAGIGLTQVPLTAYMIILSFTSVGLNVGISRLVAERMATGDAAGAKRVFRLSLLLMAGLGLVSSGAMWVGAPQIAALISAEVSDTIPGFRAMAPALFLVSLMAAYRGLFQGFQFMLPNAYSQIIEQVVRVATGIVLTYILVRYSVPMGAAGFNFGDVLGGLAGLVYLLVLVRRVGPGLWGSPGIAATSENASPATAEESGPVLLRRIFAVAAPITIVGAVVPLMMLADMFFVYRSLGGGAPADYMHAQFGLLTNAFMIVYLPAVFSTAIYTSLLPSITEAVTLHQFDEARNKAGVAYRLTLLLAFPSQAGLFVLASGLYALIYGDAAGGPVMAALSWATLAIMLQQTTSGVLQGLGSIGMPVRNFVVGAFLKAVLTAWWTPAMGIQGAAYATVVGFTFAALLNVLYVERRLGPTLDIRRMLLLPMIAALVMAGAIKSAQGPLHRSLGRPHLETLILVGVGAAAYAFALLVVRGITRADLEMIPRAGRPLAKLLARVGLVR